MQKWYVYIVRCADETLYCGITTDMERRLKQHNGLLRGGAKYTRGRRPVALCAHALCGARAHAARCEERIRHLPREQKITAVEAIMCSQVHVVCSDI